MNFASASLDPPQETTSSYVAVRAFQHFHGLTPESSHKGKISKSGVNYQGLDPLQECYQTWHREAMEEIIKFKKKDNEKKNFLKISVYIEDQQIIDEDVCFVSGWVPPTKAVEMKEKYKDSKQELFFLSQMVDEKHPQSPEYFKTHYKKYYDCYSQPEKRGTKRKEPEIELGSGESQFSAAQMNALREKSSQIPDLGKEFFKVIVEGYYLDQEGYLAPSEMSHLSKTPLLKDINTLYLHTEHGALYYLNKREVAKLIVEKLDEKLLSQGQLNVTINMASFLSCCKNCGHRLFREGEWGHSLLQELYRLLNEKKIHIIPTLSVYVSYHQPHSKSSFTDQPHEGIPYVHQYQHP